MNISHYSLVPFVELSVPQHLAVDQQTARVREIRIAPHPRPIGQVLYFQAPESTALVQQASGVG